MDLETHDPNLMEQGPGDLRGDGEVVGVALAVEGFSRYYPIAHEGGGNCDRDNVLAYVRDVVSRSRRITGANLYYDLGWGRTIGLDPAPFSLKVEDVQLLEPLIEEESKSFSLDSIAKKYVGRGKQEAELIEAAKAAGYGKDPKGNLWRLPASSVGPYAEEDARLPLEIVPHQLARINEEDLHEILALEQDVFWVVNEMRRQGVPVDVQRAIELDHELALDESELLRDICNEAGFEMNPWSADDLLRFFVQENLSYPLTPGGNPSFEAEFLGMQEHPVLLKIVDYRKVNKMRRDFISGGVMHWQINGRIHSEIHPLRGESHGTRVGRLSYSRPNLQQTPSPGRDPKWGTLVRSLYVPSPGHCWARFDYSQQEPRLTVHYAALRGFPRADEAARRYREDPTTDYHQMVADMVGIERTPAKTINLGMTYGMGRTKLINSLNVPNEEGLRLWKLYHRELPYIQRLSDELTQIASSRGYIRTLGGRRKRYNKWQPVDWDLRKKHNYRAYEIDEARETWPNEPLCRAFTHKALNNEIQGSGADVTKKAMVECFKAGFVPLIQVHDELDFELEDLSHANIIKEAMESVYSDRLTIPLRVDITTGNNWGEC